MSLFEQYHHQNHIAPVIEDVRFITEQYHRQHEHIGPVIEAVRAFLINCPDWSQTTSPRKAYVQQALNDFHTLLAHADAQITAKAAIPLTNDQVNTLLLALDSVFFNDHVFGGQVKLDFKWGTDGADPPFDDDVPAWGWTQVEFDQQTLLRVDPEVHRTGLELINTFIHEMIHILIGETSRAWFYLRGEKEHCNEACEQVAERLEGHGHACYFLRLASMIEQASQRICGYAMDIGRLAAIVEECRDWAKEGAHDRLPGLSYFQHWHNMHPFPNVPNAEAAFFHVYGVNCDDKVVAEFKQRGWALPDWF